MLYTYLYLHIRETCVQPGTANINRAGINAKNSSQDENTQ